ncbi:MAG: SAM-dependent methyltransferase [Candidatus Bathyarchaeota archaeon]|nr:SAM-dependent methyltransferase [Candidatus Bathyarchaeota archaeon]
MDWTILLPVSYFLVLGFLLWLIWPIFIGAIFLPTPRDIVDKMVAIADVGEGDIVYDLGSGDGRIVIEAAERGARGVGVEADPIRVLWSRLRARRSHVRDRIRFIWGDFFKNSVAEATVVTVYQGESINNRLREKFEAELRPGSRIVSFSFKFEGWEPAKKHHDADVYLYIIPVKD